MMKINYCSQCQKHLDDIPIQVNCCYTCGAKLIQPDKVITENDTKELLLFETYWKTQNLRHFSFSPRLLELLEGYSHEVDAWFPVIRTLLKDGHLMMTRNQVYGVYYAALTDDGYEYFRDKSIEDYLSYA